MVTKPGSWMDRMPSNMPRTSEIHTGFIRFFKGFLRSPPAGMSMTMPQL